MRNKAVWGVPENAVRTTFVRTKTGDALDAPHVHAITKSILWFRELWLDFSLNELLGLRCANNHTFKLGAFPFELGRGIALGSAYAVNGTILGSFSDNTIDQFAYGFKFSGQVISSLQYDLYGAILRNQMESFNATAANVRGQEYGHKENQQRGSGRVDFVVASRLQWYPEFMQSEASSASFEPYILYNNAPSQMVEFPEDASTQLCTLGMAGEYVIGDFEWGFDVAKNVGHQSVRGWDRNEITGTNRYGAYTFINSQVTTLPDGKGDKVVYVGGSQAQKAIDAVPQDAKQNNQCVNVVVVNGSTVCQPVQNPASATPLEIPIYNSPNRFRDAYANQLKGWMMVGDAAYWLFDRQLRFAGMFGYATGDENPNLDLDSPNESVKDSDFKGFIGLQELYSGDRVQSVFLLGGAGRAPRPLSLPSRNLINTNPTNLSGFTNLITTGASIYYSPSLPKHQITLRSNVLSYWQQHATKAFDLATKSVSKDRYARNFLGIEWNVFFDVMLATDFKFFAVGSLFFPGSHYTDIKGQPLNKEQQKILDRLDVTGIDPSSIPLISNDTAYTLNLGLEYRF